MTDAVIRRAGLADAEVLAAIGAATFSETFAHLYPPEDLRAFLADAYSVAATLKHLSDPRSAAWLLESGGRAIGHALVGPCKLPHPAVTPQCGELKRIYVLKACQGGGRGTRLLAPALAWLEREGPRGVWLGVWSKNHGAQRLYERLGFKKVGEYEFLVGKTRDHDFIMRRG